MYYAALLSGSFVLSVVALLALWLHRQNMKAIHLMTEAIKSQSSSRPKSLSALGDAVDALQIQLREVDTKADQAVSMARSNRMKITRMQGTGEAGAEPSGESASPTVPALQRVRLPGRTS